MKKYLILFFCLFSQLACDNEVTQRSIHIDLSENKIKKQVIATTGAPIAIGPYSQAIMVDNTLYSSGQIGVDPALGELQPSLKAQVRQIMDNHEAILKSAGMELNDVVKTTIFLTNMADYEQVNEIYAEYFDELMPARETVEVAALPMKAKVEISMISVK